jgi:hypothetical protein
MYQPTRPYDDDFPVLQEQVKDRACTLPQVHNPQGVNADGRPKQVTQAEAVLNWQSQNAIAQNSVLHRIESKVDLVQTNLKKIIVSIDSRILHLEQLCVEIQQRISTIHEYLLLQASNSRHVDPQKEHEIQSLKIQLKSLQAELAKSKSKPLPFLEPPQTRMTPNLHLPHLNYLETQTLKNFSNLSPKEIKGKPQYQPLSKNPDHQPLSSLHHLILLNLKSMTLMIHSKTPGPLSTYDPVKPPFQPYPVFSYHLFPTDYS